MKKRVCSLILLIGIVSTAVAQKRTLNQDWEFQRLKQIEQKGEINNQGTDWSSQYKVEHVSVANKELRIAQDTLNSELQMLNTGMWANVNLPHIPFIEPFTVLHQWQGICYYKKQLTVTPYEAARQLWIEFEGAMHLADVWINGKHVTQHAGGYTPFVIDVTGLLKAGVNNELLVRLDNRDNPLIPPGKPLHSLDFCYYGGIYRDVHLLVKPSVHITHPILANKQAGGGVFVTYPKVSEIDAEVSIQTEVANKESDAKSVVVRQTLFEWSKASGKGKKVKTTQASVLLAADHREQLAQTLHLTTPKLWHPDTPNLYWLCSEVIVDGKVVDREETRIGLRRMEMTREKGFLINGKPLRLVGSNRHMEYPYVGNALSDRAQYRDMHQIRTNGFNIVRLGHYPQDASVLDACDELGLLAIEPIPGWQFFNNNPIFTALTYRDVRDMIRRDRNHPSIVMWEVILNEAWPSAAWKDEAIRTAHQEYPGDQCFTSGDTYGYDGFDVSYNDWEEGFHRPNKSKNPGFIREYYDYEFGGHFSTTRVKRGDGQKALLQNAWNAQWSHNRYRAYYPWTMGDAVWSMYDYNRGCCDNICYSGVADMFRLPKFALSFYRTQLPAGSFLPSGKMPYEVFIANYWAAGTPSDTVVVFGNVEEVALEVNGKMVRRQSADSGGDTDYVASADGGNCRSLTYPPFTFTGVAWEAGTLRAIGYHQGKQVTEQLIRTPQAPHALEISYFESGQEAAINDLLIVHVRLTDVAGMLCPLNGVEVSLSVRGGEVVGPAVYATEAGIASFLIRTDTRRKLSIEASTRDFKERKKLTLAAQ